MKDSKKLFEKLGFVGIGLCAACCLLPIVGVLFGMGSLTFISGYLEIAGVVAITVVMIVFIIQFMLGKKAPVCDIDCACKQDENKVNM